MATLDLLDSIPWSEYGNGYGAPEEIPHLIRTAVADGRGIGANTALADLSNELCHQFSVSPVAEAAVPVLARLSSEVDYPMRADLIVLLGYCAQPRSKFGTASLTVQPTMDDPIRLAVRSALPALLRLADADPRVRPDVAALSAGFPEATAVAVARLAGWLAEASAAGERFPIAFALAVLGRRDEAILDVVATPPGSWPIDLHRPVLDWLLGRHGDNAPPTRFATAHATLEAAWSRHG